MLCLSLYIMSLLEAVTWYHCFGLIHKFTCIVIIINVYMIYMVLITNLLFNLRMETFVSQTRSSRHGAEGQSSSLSAVLHVTWNTPFKRSAPVVPTSM